MKNIYQKILPLIFLFFSVAFYGQSIVQKQVIREKSNIQALTTLKSKYKNLSEQTKQRVNQYLRLHPLEKYKQNKDGSFDELVDISNDEKPIYNSIQNVNAAISSRANHLNSGGSLGLNLNGQNMTVHVWDGGPVRINHQEFNTRVTIGDGATLLNSNSFHSTHVTGTISALGIEPNAKGMANQAQIITYDWNNDLQEALNAASNGMLLSNHSYGASSSSLPDWQFGAYTFTSGNWDAIMYNAPYYLMVKSAGNDGTNTFNNSPLNGNSVYDKLAPRATAKNNLVVAAANDATVNSSGDLINASVASFSSQGPTNDLRIKPDITGNGVSLYSTDSDSNADYRSLSGTSMSSPNVTGTLLLLQQHYNNLNQNFMRASTLKGLVLHTADDIGQIGPDAITGWGLLNAKKAAEVISNNENTSIIEETTLSNGAVYNVTVESDGINPLIASISWTDAPGFPALENVNNHNTPVLVNDLDIRATKNNATYFPYKLTSITTNGLGDNTVDPYEKIQIDNASGTYNITISHKGNLDLNSQNFSLIITGISSCKEDLNITQAIFSGETIINEVSNTITSYSQIESNADVIYSAGNKILLKASYQNDSNISFHAKSGSKFLAKIEGCSSTMAKEFTTKTINDYVYIDNIEKPLKENIELINLYPNPTSSSVKITSTENIASWVLTNSFGRVYIQDQAKSKNLKAFTLDLINYPVGIYILRVTLENGDLEIKRIVKD